MGNREIAVKNSGFWMKIDDAICRQVAAVTVLEPVSVLYTITCPCVSVVDRGEREKRRN